MVNIKLGTVITLFFFLVVNQVHALEFESTEEKVEWIRSFLKDKEFRLSYPDDATEEEKRFKDQLLKDFSQQEGIEHLEPIAVGKSIEEPEIAKYNTACPDRKPIDVYRMWSGYGNVAYPFTEEELEDPKWDFIISHNRCTGNLKVYRFNVFNMQDDAQGYVLYCDHLKTIRFQGKDLSNEKEEEEDAYSRVASYLYFNPNKCLFPDEIIRNYSLMDNYVTGIFKYKDGLYYFYTIKTVYVKGAKTKVAIITVNEKKYDFYYYHDSN